MDYTKCPCCSAKTSNAHPKAKFGSVRICGKCGAEYGDIGYKGDLCTFISLRWFTGEAQSEPVYVDFSYLGSEGLGRWHGWINPETRQIVQTG